MTAKQPEHILSNINMTIEQAIDLVDQVCARFQGSRSDHDHLRYAIMVIKQHIKVLLSSIEEETNDG